MEIAENKVSDYFFIAKSRNFVVTLNSRGLNALRVREGVVDWGSEVSLTLPQPLAPLASAAPLHSSQNSSAKEFWFLHSRETLMVFSLRFADKKIRPVIQSTLTLTETFLNIFSISDEYFVGLTGEFSLAPFILSKSGATFFRPQSVGRGDLRGVTRRVEGGTVEDFRGCLQLNEENTSYLAHGTHSPEVFVLGKKEVAKFRLKHHLDVLDGLAADEEFVFAFRFLEAALKFQLRQFWGLPSSPDTRKTKVDSRDPKVLRGSRLEIPQHRQKPLHSPGTRSMDSNPD